MAFINNSVEGSGKVAIFTSEFLMGKTSFSRKKKKYIFLAAQTSFPQTLLTQNSQPRTVSHFVTPKNKIFSCYVGVNFPTSLSPAVCATGG